VKHLFLENQKAKEHLQLLHLTASALENVNGMFVKITIVYFTMLVESQNINCWWQHDWWMWITKDLEGSDHVLTKVLSLHLHGGTDKNNKTQKKTVKIAHMSAKNW